MTSGSLNHSNNIVYKGLHACTTININKHKSYLIQARHQENKPTCMILITCRGQESSMALSVLKGHNKCVLLGCALPFSCRVPVKGQEVAQEIFKNDKRPQ